MSRAKHTALLGLLVESDGEDSDILIEGPVAQKRRIETMPAAKTSRAVAGDEVTRPTQNATRRADEKSAIGTGRKPLTEKTTNAQKKSDRTRGKKRPLPEDIEALDASVEEESDSNVKPKGGRGRPRGAKAAKLAVDQGEGAIVDGPKPAAQPARRGRKPKAQVEPSSAELEIPETQQHDVEFPESRVAEMMDDDREDESAEDVPAFNRRVQPTSAPGPELSDSSLRRRIGELTRKYDSLEVKYKDLREIGVVEAERNFDKLKKQGEERAKTANDLIASLKAQLVAQTELAKEGQKLRQRLEASEREAVKLQDRIDETTNSLADAKKEIKTLSTKLAASRAAEAANVTKVPGSAIKGSTANKQLLANAESAVQNAQLKEDLYADLTGLIIRSAKREREEETYDCIQTGRNGTLHFKLSIGTEDSVEDGDEPHFMYRPQLDPDRDRELIDLLPDYLVDEITFSRPQAAKFYHRVLKFLNEALE